MGQSLCDFWEQSVNLKLDLGFQAKKLKCQLEVKIALARKLIAGGKFFFRI